MLLSFELAAIQSIEMSFTDKGLRNATATISKLPFSILASLLRGGVDLFGRASGSSGSGLHPYNEHCSIGVVFLSPPFPSHCSVVLFTEPVKLEFLAPPAPVLTRYSV